MENLDNTVKLSDAIVPFPTDPLPNAAEIREIKSLSQGETLNYLPQSATHDDEARRSETDCGGF